MICILFIKRKSNYNKVFIMKTNKYIPIGFIVGLIAGLIYGVVSDNIAYGISFGTLIGLIIGVVAGTFFDDPKK